MSNSSFEIQLDCIHNSISYAVPWNTICGGGGSGCSCLHSCHTDSYTQAPYQYFNSCLQSYQMPKTGIAYAEFSSFVQSPSQESNIPFLKLVDTLKAGKIYCVTYYVSMWNNARYGIDKLGALLTPTAFPEKLPVTCTSSNTVAVAGLYTPQVVTPPGVVFEDTLNWMEVSATYTANGTEAYITLGDFFLQSQHSIVQSYPSNCNGVAEYYLDDVSVEVVEIAKAKNDTIIMQGDSVIIGNNASEAAVFNWQPSIGLSCTSCPNPKASPTITTTYTVTKTQCKVTTSDVITVSVSPTGVMEAEALAAGIRILPNPTSDVITVNSKYDFEKIELTDITGKLLVSEAVNSKEHQLQLQNFAEGIYFVKVTFTNGLSVTKKVVKQ